MSSKIALLQEDNFRRQKKADGFLVCETIFLSSKIDVFSPRTRWAAPPPPPRPFAAAEPWPPPPLAAAHGFTGFPLSASTIQRNHSQGRGRERQRQAHPRFLSTICLTRFSSVASIGAPLRKLLSTSMSLRKRKRVLGDLAVGVIALRSASFGARPAVALCCARVFCCAGLDSPFPRRHSTGVPAW